MTKILDHRNFLLMAFHPYGHAACEATGMMPASIDVMEKELAIAERVFSADLDEAELRRIYERALWYMEAAQEMVEADVGEYERSLLQDLVAFYIAMKAEEYERSQNV